VVEEVEEVLDRMPDEEEGETRPGRRGNCRLESWEIGGELERSNAFAEERRAAA
jgi:hypothetical protein